MKKAVWFALILILINVAAEAKPVRRAAGTDSNRTVYDNSNAEPVSYFRKSSMDGYRDLRPSLYSLSPVVGGFASSIRGNTISDSQFGFQAGASVLMGIYKMHYEVGAYYARRGGAYSFGNDITGQINLEYVEVPTLIRYAYGYADQTHLFFRGGLVWAALMNAKAKSKSSWAEAERDSTEGYNTIDPRGLVGLGMNIRLSSSVFMTVQAEYQRSLMSIHSSSETAMYNDSIGASTGMVFPL